MPFDGVAHRLPKQTARRQSKKENGARKMCGIAGVFEYGLTAGGVSEDILLSMQATLRHRGPDGDGIFLSPDRRLGLAHRRLAIIDIEAGAQPMRGPDGTWLVFNGEIYNYPQLRESLIADGVQFETRCDTEVILHLYRRHGERCVDHLTGMFAFALWDPHRESLFFARDPIGEKPFYWCQRNGVFVFGSEIKALLEHPATPREVNRDAIGP
jgi:asparagine synthase (glutamine-hydrolysing)